MADGVRQAIDCETSRQCVPAGADGEWYPPGSLVDAQRQREPFAGHRFTVQQQLQCRGDRRRGVECKGGRNRRCTIGVFLLLGAQSQDGNFAHVKAFRPGGVDSVGVDGVGQQVGQSVRACLCSGEREGEGEVVVGMARRTYVSCICRVSRVPSGYSSQAWRAIVMGSLAATVSSACTFSPGTWGGVDRRAWTTRTQGAMMSNGHCEAEHHLMRRRGPGGSRQG